MPCAPPSRLACRRWARLLNAALYALTRCLAAPSWTNVILAALLAGAATQQRYAGGIAVIVGTFCLMFLRRDVPASCAAFPPPLSMA